MGPYVRFFQYYKDQFQLTVYSQTAIDDRNVSNSHPDLSNQSDFNDQTQFENEVQCYIFDPEITIPF